MAAKVACRTPMAVRLPDDQAKAIEAYARQHRMTKTDALVHFLSRGMEDGHASDERLVGIEASLGEVLRVIGTTRDVSSPTLGVRRISDVVTVGCSHFPSVRRAYLFGSFARGDASPTSDVDLRLVIGDEGTFSLYDLARLKKELEDGLGRAVDLVTAAEIGNPNLAQAIEREKVLVYDSEGQ